MFAQNLVLPKNSQHGDESTYLLGSSRIYKYENECKASGLYLK